MKNFALFKRLIILLVSLGIYCFYNQGLLAQHGSHVHNNREHNEDWPDSLQTITVSGQVSIDSSHFHPMFFLDEGNDGSVDYQLGFGPYWYHPESGATRPTDGAQVTIKGGLVENHTPLMIVVFEIDGLVWRDSAGAPPWSGGWVYKNATDTTFIHCPTDSLDWLGYPSQSMHGMMFPDSIYCQFEEVHPDSMPGMPDSTFFEGYYTENFRDHGNHMRGGSMMMGFNRSIGMRFHYDEGELVRRGLSENNIQVRYLDSNFNWQIISEAVIDVDANTISINQQNVRTFYGLSASLITSVANQEASPKPEKFTLLPNFPNPFNPQTTIRYESGQNSNIKLAIYDIRGRLVKVLFQGVQTAGEHSMVWNGTDENGRIVASGVYLLKLQSNGFSQTRKLTLLK